MRHTSHAIAVAAVVGIVGAGTSAFAANPTKADFDACNKQAQAAIGTTGSASPRASTGPSGTPGGTGSSAVSGSTSAGSTSTGPSGTPGETKPGTSPSSPAMTSDSMRGITGPHATDPGYRQAYMDCMKKRGF
jgi:hypothetical protein